MAAKQKLTPDTIVRAAAEIVDAGGTEELTLASLAQKLDIRSPSLYNHIAGLPDVRRLLSLHGLEQLRNVMLHAAVGRAGDEAIREMAKAYLAFARAHPGLYEMTLLPPGPEDAERTRIAQEILDLVIRGLGSYRLGEIEVIHAARALRSLLHGFASLEGQGGFGIPLDLDQSFSEMVGIFLAGLHARYPAAEENGFR